MKKINRTVTALTFVAMFASAAKLQGGSLNPPAGPIAPTHKTLTDVEPRIAINATNTPGDANSLFKITQRGSYYLTGSITGVSGKHGIEIAASGVTIDLNGFDLVGIAGMGAFDGLSTSVSNLTDIAIRNGSVRNWGDEGVDLGGSGALNSIVENVRASGNAGVGIVVGTDCIVRGCTAYANGENGISTNSGCGVTGCTATGNSLIGIVAITACTIHECAAYDNSGVGILTFDGCSITGCTLKDNGSTGLLVASGCTIIECTAYANAGVGIQASTSCTISRCTAKDSGGMGIATGDACSITDCSAYNNSGDGISTSIGSLVDGCVAHGNSGNGLKGSHGCSIIESNARANDLDGIRVTQECLVRGNSSSNNAGAGVHATGNDSRIEGNICKGNAGGIRVDGVHNLIIKNTCALSSPNFSITANNSVADIGPSQFWNNSSAIAGDSYDGFLGSDDPNANIAY